MVSNAGGVLTRELLATNASSDPELINAFTSRLLGAKHAHSGKRPWVMVTPLSKAQTLLAVYHTLKQQGKLEEWAGEYYDVRRESGVCVLALLP